jgi:hypothetical protein
MVPAVQNFIVERMSQQYIEPPTFDLSLSYEDSQHFSPLIFVLSPGADPMAGLYRFAEEKGIASSFVLHFAFCINVNFLTLEFIFFIYLYIYNYLD